jgi:hypothetical protein
MKNSGDKIKKVHKWRLCPEGQHWVVTHPMHVPPSSTHPNGYITTRHEHCALNPSGKDQFFPDEIKEISNKYFESLKEKPCPLDLGFKNTGNKYDDLIAGWTQYWNDIFNPTNPLDANIVKALIASESGFDPSLLANKKDSNSARGLMQITNETRKILGDEKGEIHDHYITASKEDLNDPSINICAGIRWIIQKQKLASSFLGRNATWEEAILNYKSILKKSDSDGSKIRLKKIFDNFLDKLKKCGK